MNRDNVEEKIENAETTQWHKFGDIYFPARPTVRRLPPGYYEVFNTYNGIRFEKMNISTTGIFLTGSPNAQEIVADIDTFWGSRAIFDEYEVIYKRGVFLSGPPGSGKTCIIKVIAQRLIDRGGALLSFGAHVGLIGAAVKDVRNIHPNMPLIIVMEDMDRWLVHSGPEQLMNIMDGMTAIDGVIFIGTANCPEVLDDALMDRPGRFDAHYKIMPPRDDVRKDFIKRCLRSRADKENLQKWTEDTKNMPFGHIKELAISVTVFNKDYEKTLSRLRSMREGQNEDEEDGEGEASEEVVATSEGNSFDLDGLVEKTRKRATRIRRVKAR